MAGYTVSPLPGGGGGGSVKRHSVTTTLPVCVQGVLAHPTPRHGGVVRNSGRARGGVEPPPRTTPPALGGFGFLKC